MYLKLLFNFLEADFTGCFANEEQQRNTHDQHVFLETAGALRIYDFSSQHVESTVNWTVLSTPVNMNHDS